MGSAIQTVRSRRRIGRSRRQAPDPQRGRIVPGVRRRMCRPVGSGCYSKDVRRESNRANRAHHGRYATSPSDPGLHLNGPSRGGQMTDERRVRDVGEFGLIELLAASLPAEVRAASGLRTRDRRRCRGLAAGAWRACRRDDRQSGRGRAFSPRLDGLGEPWPQEPWLSTSRISPPWARFRGLPSYRWGSTATSASAIFRRSTEDWERWRGGTG